MPACQNRLKETLRATGYGSFTWHKINETLYQQWFQPMLFKVNDPAWPVNKTAGK
jgi:hypothetical protein